MIVAEPEAFPAPQEQGARGAFQELQASVARVAWAASVARVAWAASVARVAWVAWAASVARVAAQMALKMAAIEPIAGESVSQDLCPTTLIRQRDEARLTAPGRAP